MWFFQCLYETSEKLDTNATDIGSALEYAATLLPENKAGHIILLSDGKQTDEDAMATVQCLKSKGIRVDGVYFDTTQFPGDEVQLGSITTPEGACVGNALSFVADVQSNVDTQITLSLYDGTVLMLADIAIRKLRWKDIRNYLITGRKK